MIKLANISTNTDHQGHKPKGRSRKRKCIVSGNIMNPHDMLRFVLDPDGQVLADIYGKLPARGAWITPSRVAVEKAIKTNAFERSFKTGVKVDHSLLDQIEAGLANKLLGLVGMAKRAGQLEIGFENVKSCAQNANLGARIEASDGSSDGRAKIRVICKAIARELAEKPPILIACFTARELGKALGRDHIVHLGVVKGTMLASFIRESKKLAGFRALIPKEWPDFEHEVVYYS